MGLTYYICLKAPNRISWALLVDTTDCKNNIFCKDQYLLVDIFYVFVMFDATYKITNI